MEIDDQPIFTEDLESIIDKHVQKGDIDPFAISTLLVLKAAQLAGQVNQEAFSGDSNIDERDKERLSRKAANAAFSAMTEAFKEGIGNLFADSAKRKDSSEE